MSESAAQNQTARPAGATPAASANLPDGPRVQDQFAALAEGGEMRPLIEFLRALLNARAIALFPAPGRALASSVIVTTRGILATSLAPLGERLAGATGAVVEPAESLGADGYSLAVPVRREEKPIWVLVAQLVVPDARDLQAYLVILQTAAGWLLYREQRGATTDVQWVLERTSGLLDVFRRAGVEDDADKACRIAVDALRDYLGCSRVSFAASTRRGLRVRAISGVQKVDPKSPDHQALEAAMHEAAAEGARMDFPGTGDIVAHELLAEKNNAQHVTSLPFQRGVLVCEWNTATDHRTPALLDATLPFAPPLFEMLERSRPIAPVRFLRRAWRRATQRRRRAIIAAAVALAALLAFPFHYSVKCDCRLDTETKRIIAAPFEGNLGRTRVQPGDRVAEGDVLVALDSRELKLKEAELSAAREQALKKRDRAMSSPDGADFAAAQVAAFEAESVTQELALVQRKIALLEIRAPIAGVVVAGDLRRSEGQPVRQGQVLFEVAPLDTMLVEIAVPDHQISRVRAGMPVAMRLEAHGGWEGATTVSRLFPASEQRDGRNIFIAEAPLAAAGMELRPGMRGRATIEGDRRPLAWQLTHRLFEWIETTLWW